jgi:hypothetical protein
VQAGLGPREGGGAVRARQAGRRSCEAKVEVGAGVTRRGFDAQCKTGGRVAGPGGPGGIGLARPRVRAGVFYRWPARLGSAGVCACNRPCTSRLRASGVRAERKQRARDATRCGDPAGGYAGVPTVFLQHTRVSSGSLAREQENPEVRGGVGIANQSGSIVLSHGPRHPAAPIPHRSSEQDHNTSRKLMNPLVEPL